MSYSLNGTTFAPLREEKKQIHADQQTRPERRRARERIMVQMILLNLFKQQFTSETNLSLSTSSLPLSERENERVHDSTGNVQSWGLYHSDGCESILCLYYRPCSLRTASSQLKILGFYRFYEARACSIYHYYVYQNAFINCNTH